MGTYKDQYINYLADNPDIKRIDFDFDLLSIAAHFNTTVIEKSTPIALDNGIVISMPDWAIDWEHASGTQEEHEEFLYKSVLDFIKAAKNAEPFNFNDRHSWEEDEHGFPPITRAPIDVREFVEMTPKAREKYLNSKPI